MENLFEYFTTDNISGKKCTEKWLFKNNEELHNNIINWCDNYKELKYIEFKKKIFHYINNLIEIPKCLTCNKDVKFLNIRLGYQKYCSNKCVKNSKEYYNKWLHSFQKNDSGKNGIIKRRCTCIDKYGSLENYNIILKNKRKILLQKDFGVDNVFQLDYVKNKSKKTKIDKYGDEYWNNKDKTREIRIRNGTQIDDNLIESFLIYKKIIVNRSTTIYRNNVNEINPMNLKRGIKNFHIDHKYSIKQGFLNNVPIEIISHPCNLTMIWWKDNLEKQDKCNITLKELISNILRYENKNIIKQSKLNELYQKENIQKLIK